MNARIVTILLLPLVFAGCATMNQAECVHADWRMIGAEDGSKGLGLNALGNYRESCAKHGITPDLAEYRRGRDEGLKSFCTEHMGYTRGRSGYQYTGVCPANLENTFLMGYDVGREIYQIEGKAKQLRAQINQNIQHMEANETLLEEKVILIADSESTAVERVQLLLDLKNIQQEQVELEALNRELAIELSEVETDLAQRSVSYAY